MTQAEPPMDVLATLPHPVFWKDATLHYVGANPAYLALRGLTSDAPIVGRAEGESGLDDELAAVIAAAEQELVLTRRPVEDREVTLGVPEGPPRLLLVSVYPRTADGRLDGVIGVVTDVTAVGRQAWQLAQSTRLEAIGHLAAGIAHEINTPIQFVCDNARFLRDCFDSILPALSELSRLAERSAPDDGAASSGGPQGGLHPDPLAGHVRRILDSLDLEYLAEEVPAALDQSLEGLDRVTRIVRATKDFAHPGSVRADTDVNRAVESTANVSRNEWKYVAELTLDLDPEVGLVPCYEGELKQVLLNLIVNAAQAIGERPSAVATRHPGRIRVGTRRTSDSVLIEVTDNGPGMDDAVRARCFDPFFTTKEVGQGTGHGLSLALAVARKHDGELRVESDPGLSTTFTLILPAPRLPPDGAEPRPVEPG